MIYEIDDSGEIYNHSLRFYHSIGMVLLFRKFILMLKSTTLRHLSRIAFYFHFRLKSKQNIIQA